MPLSGKILTARFVTISVTAKISSTTIFRTVFSVLTTLFRFAESISARNRTAVFSAGRRGFVAVIFITHPISAGTAIRRTGLDGFRTETFLITDLVTTVVIRTTVFRAVFCVFTTFSNAVTVPTVGFVTLRRRTGILVRLGHVVLDGVERVQAGDHLSQVIFGSGDFA